VKPAHRACRYIDPRAPLARWRGAPMPLIPWGKDLRPVTGCGRRGWLRRSEPGQTCASVRASLNVAPFSTEAVHTGARVNVTCVTPLGEETAST
jgi:hypothetical protein